MSGKAFVIRRMTWSPLVPGLTRSQVRSARSSIEADRGSGVRGDEHPGFVEEWDVRVSARGQARVLVSFDDEDVVLAGAQRGHARGLFCFLDAQVDAGEGLDEVGGVRESG